MNKKAQGIGEWMVLVVGTLFALVLIVTLTIYQIQSSKAQEKKILNQRSQIYSQDLLNIFLNSKSDNKMLNIDLLILDYYNYKQGGKNTFDNLKIKEYFENLYNNPKISWRIEIIEYTDKRNRIYEKEGKYFDRDPNELSKIIEITSIKIPFKNSNLELKYYEIQNE